MGKELARQVQGMSSDPAHTRLERAGVVTTVCNCNSGKGVTEGGKWEKLHYCQPVYSTRVPGSMRTCLKKIIWSEKEKDDLQW